MLELVVHMQSGPPACHVQAMFQLFSLLCVMPAPLKLCSKSDALLPCSAFQR